MTRAFIAQLSDGDNVEDVFLVRDKQVRTNRNGAMYLQCELDDRTGSIGARYWNATDTEAGAFEAGDFLVVKGKIQLFQGHLQLIAQSFRLCDPEAVALADFIPASEKCIDALLADLREIMGALINPYLQAIAQAFLIDADFVHRLTQAPAGIRHHHAYLGGLLEHMVNMLQVVDRIIDLYPDLDHDLLRMGVFLHDLGKTRELAYERGFMYTDEGQLVGHLVIGVEMLDEKLPVATDLLGEPIPLAVVLSLKHLILSHHGTYEFGSPRLPMTPEAIALHHLDNLDAKVHNYAKTIKEDLNTGSGWTPYDHAAGRRLFKGHRRNGSPNDPSES